MSTNLRIKNDDFVESYKQLCINSAIGFGIWKAKYPKSWIAAGGGTLTIDGREYFGGSLRLDKISTPEKEEFALLNGFDLQQIRKLQAKSQVKHVDLKLSPEQTFTKEGLDYYFGKVLKPELEALGTVTLELTKDTGAKNTLEEVQYPLSFRQSASEKFYLFQTDQISLEVVYIVSDLLDTYATTEHIVYGGNYTLSDNSYNWEVFNEDNADNYTIYKGETNITITLDNFDFLLSLADDLYDVVHLGDKDSDYYDSEDGLYYSQKTLAGCLWNEEFQYAAGDTWATQDIYNSLDGLVIYHDKHYYIDLQMWKSASPTRCLLALGRLVHIRVVEDEGFFGTPIIGPLFKAILTGLNALVRGLGIIIYSVQWVAGLWKLDVAANWGYISKKDLGKFKEIAYQVLGTAALIIITWGSYSYAAAGTLESASTVGEYIAAQEAVDAAALTATDFALAGVQVIGAGISAEAQYNATHTKFKKYEQQKQEERKNFDFTYDDEDNELYIADTFYEYYDELLDPYSLMDE